MLGPVEVVTGDERHELGGPKQRTVLSLIVAAGGQQVSTDALVHELYGDDASPNARRSIQTFVSTLRRELGDLIVGTTGGYRLQEPAGTIDAQQFEDLLEHGRLSLEDDAGGAAATLREALALWRGNPYADAEQRDVLYLEAKRLIELRLVAIEARIEADLALGRHQQLVAELEALTAEHPYREQFRAHHMLALYRSGRQTEALRAYQQTRRILAEELGIDPSPQLSEMEQQILDHDPRLVHTPRIGVTRKALVAFEFEMNSHRTDGSGDRELLVARAVQADAVVASAVASHGGRVFAQRLRTTFAAFETVDDALAAASDAVRDTGSANTGTDAHGSVRVAVDVGEVEVGPDNEITGPPVARVAGLAVVAHPGQIVLSAKAQAGAAATGGWTVRGLGAHSVPHMHGDEQLYQLVVQGIPDSFPPLRSDGIPPSLPGAFHTMPGYELRREVRRGHGYVVWQAYQPSVGREVALRVIVPELSNEPRFVRRFEVDALSVARLDHPHVVPLYDYWRDQTGAYLVSQWMSGKRLADEMTEHRLNESDVDRLVRNVGSALAAAHGVGVVHGDVSPVNIFRDAAGSFQIGNFGIAHGLVDRTEDPNAKGGDIEGLRRTIETAAAPSKSVARFLASSADAKSVEQMVAMWEDTQAPGTQRPSRRALIAVRNPYRGLAAYTEAHAADFYGRVAATHDLIAALGRQRFVAVVGPSGVGKSSVVNAGLLPAVRRGVDFAPDGAFVVEMTPGARPVEALAAALLRSAVVPMPELYEQMTGHVEGVSRALRHMFPADAAILIVVDQFEELFTLTTEPDRRERFLDLLTELATDSAVGARIVATLRADFFDAPLLHAGMGELLRSGTVPLAAPNADELREMIEAPAAAVGVGYEPGLVDRIVSDVVDEAGRLPLLGYALRELFERRSGEDISITDYNEIGGVIGVLGRRAEDAMHELDAVDEATIRQVMLRLVRLGSGGEPARRRVRMSELQRMGTDPADVGVVIRAFADQRLLTFDRDPVTRGPTVEVAHEAIFAQWDRMAGWIEEYRDDLDLRRRLLTAVDEWEGADRDPEMLLTPGRLARFEDWARESPLSLSATEQGYLAASREREEAARRQRTRVRTLAFAAITAVALVAIALAIVANSASHRARILAADALVGDANFRLASGQFEEAAIGLTESFRLNQSVRPLTAMGAIVNGHEIWGSSLADVDGATAVKVAVDWQAGVAATAGATASVPLFDVETGALLGVIAGRDAIGALAFTSDGRLVTGDRGGGLAVWDVSSRERVSDVFELEAEISDLVVTAEDDVVVSTFKPDDRSSSVVVSIEMDASGAWSTKTRFDVDGLDNDRGSLAGRVEIVRLVLAPDGRRLVTLGRPVLAAVWALDSGDLLTSHAGSGRASIWGGVFTHDGRFLVTGQQDRTLQVRNGLSLDPIGPPSAPLSGQQRSLSFAAGDRTLFTSGQAGVLVWEFSSDGELGITPQEIGVTPELTTHGHALSPDGQRLIVAVADRVRSYSTFPGVTPPPPLPDDSLRSVVATESMVWSAGEAGVIHRWNRANDAVNSVDLDTDVVSTLTHGTHAGEVYFGTGDGELGKVDIDTGVVRVRAHDNQIWAIAWSPSGELIAAASADNTVSVRDPATLEALSSFGPETDGGPAGLKSLIFVDERTVATTGGDGWLRTWDVETGQPIVELQVVEDQLNAIAVIGENLVAVGDERGTLSFVDVERGVVERTIESHTSAVRGLAVSPDGSTLASGAQDNSVRLRDIEGGAQLGLFRHAGAVRAVAFADNGARLVAVDISGEVIVWDADWTSWPGRLCGWLDGWDIDSSWPDVMGDEPLDPACDG